MKWNEMFHIDQMPSFEEIREYIGDAKANWDELVFHIEETYKVKGKLDYSKDTLQPGWNVKFRKGGKSLCTLYPMEGYFLALVVVGPKEEAETRLDMQAGLFSTYVKELYEKTRPMTIGRWLMIKVEDKPVLKDIQRLIRIRIKPKLPEADHEDVK